MERRRKQNGKLGKFATDVEDNIEKKRAETTEMEKEQTSKTVRR